MLLLAYQDNCNKIPWWQVLQDGSENHLLPQRVYRGKLDTEDR